MAVRVACTLLLKNKLFPAISILIGVPSLAGLFFGQEKAVAPEKRPVTVADTIRMTRIAGSGYPSLRPKRGFAVFSPDGKRLAMVIARGNVEKNTNEYSLLVFRTTDVSKGGKPRTLVSLSSSSNREGIVDLKWSKDNDTIYFLGANADEPAQLYSVQCSSGELNRLTSNRTSLVSYALSEQGDAMVFAAKRPETDVINEDVLRRGFQVVAEYLPDLIRGEISSYEPKLFAKGKGLSPAKPLQTVGLFDGGANDLFLSPDGRYLVVKTDAIERPERWNEYEDPYIQSVFRIEHAKGVETRILRYELIDLQTSRSEVLLDSPTTYAPADVLWSPDSKSLLLCGVYLPLDVEDQAELQSRRSYKFVVEMKLPSREFVKITNEELKPIRWDARTNIVQFQERQDQSQTDSAPQPVYYRKTGEIWQRVPDPPATVTGALPDIRAEQGLNLPPRVVAVDANTQRKVTLLDLNPQFAALLFGKVEEIHWKDGTGHPVSGGLYLPPDYVAGKRYPLVIQTHGFDADRFVIDGSHITTSAAQPLASKGIVVLQVNDIFRDSLDTLQENERAMSAYENAVEYLAQKGIIDRSRVGLVGFSRTCMYVKYTLTHSSQQFAAAIVAEGFDGGYFQYLVNGNRASNFDSDEESVIGAPPFGEGLLPWLKHSPGFLLNKVQTPLQIQALEPGSLLGEWEWFSGLKRLGKPVALLYLPTGTHILVKPWDRMVSQEGSVDWFCFWLKSEEDPDPEKAQQYARWRELRKQKLNAALQFAIEFGAQCGMP
jgi:dipeptidyl aminopeptidase/acylaminoacyl peptidase